MKEQFVTYEIALALKELGFDEACLTHYRKDIGRNSYSLQTIIKTTYMNFDAADKTDTPEHYKGYKNSINQMFGDETIAAPLWQQAWRFILTKLEENFNLVSVEIYTDDSGFVQHGQGQLFVFNDQQDGIRKAIELYENKIRKN